MYRYHFDWDVGYEATNDYLTAIFKNIDAHTNGRPIYYQTDFHSHGDNRTDEDINPDGQEAYTTCKQALLGHLRRAQNAGAEAFGWYIGKDHPSESNNQNYNPFLPERGSVYDEDTFNSITGIEIGSSGQHSLSSNGHPVSIQRDSLTFGCMVTISIFSSIDYSYERLKVTGSSSPTSAATQTVTTTGTVDAIESGLRWSTHSTPTVSSATTVYTFASLLEIAVMKPCSKRYTYCPISPHPTT